MRSHAAQDRLQRLARGSRQAAASQRQLGLGRARPLSGVRSSCAISAEKRCSWRSAASMRPSRPSSVAASAVSSSRGGAEVEAAVEVVLAPVRGAARSCRATGRSARADRAPRDAARRAAARTASSTSVPTRAIRSRVLVAGRARRRPRPSRPGGRRGADDRRRAQADVARRASRSVGRLHARERVGGALRAPAARPARSIARPPSKTQLCRSSAASSARRARAARPSRVSSVASCASARSRSSAERIRAQPVREQQVRRRRRASPGPTASTASDASVTRSRTSSGSSQRVADAARGRDLLVGARARAACGAAARRRRRACCRARSRRPATPPATSSRRRTTSPGRAASAASRRNSVGVSGTVRSPRADRVRRRVEPQAAGLRAASGSAPRAAQQRADAHEQLGERERLGQVVVAARAEAGEPVGQRAAGGQEEHRRVDAVRAQRLADVAAVGVGQADVEHEHVGRVARRTRCTASRPVAVARTSKPFGAQRAARARERSSASSSQRPMLHRVHAPIMNAYRARGLKVARSGCCSGCDSFRFVRPPMDPDLLLPGARPRPAAGRLGAVPDLEPRPQRRAAAAARLGHPPERRLLPDLPGRDALATALVLLRVLPAATGCASCAGSGRSLRDREIAADDTDAKLGWLLVVGTIPAGLLGLLLEHPLRNVFASPQSAAIFLIAQRRDALRRRAAAPQRARSSTGAGAAERRADRRAAELPRGARRSAPRRRSR